jgi:putative redox protein
VARRLLSPVCYLEFADVDVTLQYAEGARFVAEARQHRVVVDQPAQDGATDHGMTPAELLLAALGGCVGQYVAQYLSLRGLSGEGLLVHVEAKPSARPLRMKDFEVEVVVPGLTEPQLRSLQKSFPAGLVQNAISLENSLTVKAVAMRAGDVEL